MTKPQPTAKADFDLPPDLQALEDNRLATVKAWSRRTSSLIKDKLDDARAHASLGMAIDANQRLDDITAGLYAWKPGPDSTPTGLIADARADFYRRSFDHLAPFQSPDVHIADSGPTGDGEKAARGAWIHGRYALDEIKSPVQEAKKHLGQAIRQGTTQALDVWHAKALSRITAMAWRQLSDSEAAVFHAVSYLTIRPDLRPDLDDTP